MSFVRLTLLGLGAVTLQGCLMVNTVSPVTRSVETVPANRAIVIIGLGFEEVETDYVLSRPARMSSHSLGIHLDRYDPEAKQGLGNCARHDRIEYGRPPGTSTIEYAAFDVPAGWYVTGEIHLARGIDRLPVPPELTRDVVRDGEPMAAYTRHTDGRWSEAQTILHAHGGEVTYLGNWIGIETASDDGDYELQARYQEDIEAARAFASSMGLPEPQRAERRMEHGAVAAIFLCTS